MLCERCQGIFTGERILSDDAHIQSVMHHQTSSSFYKAVALGCILCRRIHREFKQRLEFDLTNWNFDKGFTCWELEYINVESTRQSPPPGSYVLTVALVGDTSRIHESMVKDPTIEMSKSSHDYILLPQNTPDVAYLTDSVDAHTGSSACWNQAVQWHRNCLENHSRCPHNDSSGNWYPTRLLDVGYKDEGHVRLCITADENLVGPYMTLSHCWGKGEILKLTESNAADLQCRINLANLPKTFVEAFEITRRLGIRYLWIDSLCIFQDSLTDWQNESAQMQHVYSNSHLNIAATASQDSNGGLFRSRNPIDVTSNIIRPTWYDIDADDFVLLQDDLWATQLRSAPLNRRAWVLQERVLAPRILHFGETQLLWECHELDACEMFPQGLPYFQFSILTHIKGIDPVVDGTKLRIFGGVDTDPILDRYRLWDRIFKNYSECDLTKSDDKLVAINGLAKEFVAVLNDTYVAGLWRNHLAEHLLWFVFKGQRGDGTPSYRPLDYRAPSWSWASVEGAVIPSDVGAGNILINIVETRVDALENGQVKFGLIRIEGQLLHTEIAEPISQTRYWLSLKIGDVYPNIDADEGLPKPHSVYCLPVRRRAISGNPYIDCLLLRHVKGGPQGRYERLGLAWVFGEYCKGFEVEMANSITSPEFYCVGQIGTLELV